jgi:hypothetical protein
MVAKEEDISVNDKSKQRELMKNLTVLWHLKQFPASLGRCAMMLAEAQAYVACDASLDIVVIEAGRSISSSLIALIRNIENVQSITTYPSMRDVCLIGDVWPSTDELAASTHDFDTTLRLQQTYAQNGVLPRIRVRREIRDDARRYMRSTSDVALAIHFKNQPGAESNGIINVWRDFIEARVETRFFLIGSDPVPAEIGVLKNVKTVAVHTLDLAFHIAVVNEADGFIGMQSGPSVFAILSDMPYVVFKNPTHHVTEMVREIGSNDCYTFAHSCQKVWREYETEARLNEALDMIISSIQTRKNCHAP